MSEGDTRAHRVDQVSTEERRGRLAASLLVWGGALLLLLASVRMVPYVRSRLTTFPVVAPSQRQTESASRLPTAIASAAAKASSAPASAPESGPAPVASPGSSPALPGPYQATSSARPATPAPPTRLLIPSISVDAPVVPIRHRAVKVAGTSLALSFVPETYAVGWHENSPPLGVPGNTVLNGHNTGHGEVFRNLYTLKVGDPIIVYSGDTPYLHTVSEILVLREAGQPLEVRRRNARYIEPTEDDRLTLVTCHPYASLRYRLIVVARPGISVSGRASRRMPGEY